MAWGGIETALVDIHNYVPNSITSTSNRSAFDIWPGKDLSLPNNLIESPQFMTLKANTGNNYNTTSLDPSAGSGYYSRVSVSYFTKAPNPPYTIARQVPIIIKKDQSAVFDIKNFNGSVKVDFKVLGGNSNILWLRAERNASIDEFGLVVGYSGSTPTSFNLISGNSSSGTGITAGAGSCSATSSGFLCSTTLNITSSSYRLLKIKAYGGRAQLTFNLDNSSVLGLPDTVIKAIGTMNVINPLTGEFDQKELYVQFPNQLKSISDVLDYSLFQAGF